ncbi:SagB/ThcOx family dehydrogenase [Prevotella cerevisiae]|jgi:SagB-type dehydrogenase family enzyme|uniref:SagB/ThcOx family dehydrogenase n=1 Tax=Segatella cerevisiae TaxID=2053716 RepID=A0ABT1BUU9_9BACT|nr:SagB/ThcOx family dehydrogenase [Segatella cerevisiae]MCH3994430.1 SagB/ThcOx family dehydrogenase [Prevotella sp.]MCO6024864.1 SagB/ThcOx family dehydrogenase [Segatella cerevisiae]
MRKQVLFALCLMMGTGAMAQNIKLPAPSNDASMTLVQALEQRHSTRVFSEKAINDNTLSQILWAACGINRPAENKTTAPSAMNAQDIEVYAIRKDGAFLYVPKDNSLKKVSSKDLRTAVAGSQSFNPLPPLSLVLVSNQAKFGSRAGSAAREAGMLDVGYVSENISLICTALGLNNVPRKTMDVTTLQKELGLPASQLILMNHEVGYPKE